MFTKSRSTWMHVAIEIVLLSVVVMLLTGRTQMAIGQGQELFTSLQRQGVPSRFINFPDEGHWVLKPRNSEYWHKEVFVWLKKYVPPGGQ